MDWYYFANDAQQGPISDDEFQALIANGTITGSTLVWNASLPEWVEYQTLAGDAPAAAPEPAPAAEPEPEPAAEPEPAKSSLKLASREEAPAAAPAADEPTAPCSQCGNTFGESDLIEFEGVQVCVECKPAFFAQIRESGSASTTEGGTGGATSNGELLVETRASLKGNWGPSVGAYIVANLYAFVAALISLVVPMLDTVANIVLSPPFEVGTFKYFLARSRNEDARVGMVFEGFQQYGRNMGMWWFRFLLILLWGLPALVVIGAGSVFSATNPNPAVAGVVVIVGIASLIPAVVKGIGYSLASVIAADDPEMRATDCVTESARMMQGKKWKFFVMHLRIAIWMILSVVAVSAMVGGMFSAMATSAMAGGSGAPATGAMIGAGVLGIVALVIALRYYPYMFTATCRFYDDLKQPDGSLS